MPTADLLDDLPPAPGAAEEPSRVAVDGDAPSDPREPSDPDALGIGSLKG